MDGYRERAGTREQEGSRGRGRRAAGRRVLVVEDHRETADTLRELLEEWGHQVAVAYSGPAGVEAARQLLPEIVLCDLGLPGHDGFGVATALRRGPEPSQAKLIAVSAYGQEEYRRRSLESGFDLHLTKPVDLERLQKMLAA